MLGGGPDSMYGRGVEEEARGDTNDDRERNNAMAGTAGVSGTMSGTADRGRADTSQADTSYPTIEGQGDRSLEQQGDAGGGSDTTGGLTYGVAGMNLPDDLKTDEELRRKRYDTTGGKTSERDSNIKTE